MGVAALYISLVARARQGRKGLGDSDNTSVVCEMIDENRPVSREETQTAPLAPCLASRHYIDHCIGRRSAELQLVNFTRSLVLWGFGQANKQAITL